MVGRYNLELPIEIRDNVAHQRKLPPHSFPICVLIIGGVDDLLREECLCRLVEHNKTRDWAIFVAEPTVQSQVSNKMISDPVLGASHPGKRYSASGLLNDNGQIDRIESDKILRSFKLKSPRKISHHVRNLVHR